MAPRFVLRYSVWASLAALTFSPGFSQTDAVPTRIEPKTVATRFTKCADCVSNTRKRVGVMPVKVTALPPELGFTAEWLAHVTRESIEKAITGSRTLSPVARGSVDAQEADSSRVPAQFLLMTTVDGVQVRKTSSEAASSGSDLQQLTAPRVYTTWLMIALMWRALDPSTGAVVAIGPVSATASANEKQLLAEATAAAASGGPDSGMYAGLARRVVAMVTEEQVRDLTKELASAPFRARIAKAQADGVVLDCGLDASLAVGDTFGVTDKSGAAVGLIRISEVHESTAFGQVLRKTGPLAPGDQLEWVGVFKPTP